MMQSYFSTSSSFGKLTGFAQVMGTQMDKRDFMLKHDEKSIHSLLWC